MKTKKLITTIAFSVIVALFASLFSLVTASATPTIVEPIYIVDGGMMEDGASIRIDTQNTQENTTTGIRFTFNITQLLRNLILESDGQGGYCYKPGYELGMIIVPEQYILDYALQTGSTIYEDCFEYLEVVKGKTKAQVSTCYPASALGQWGEGDSKIHATIIKLLDNNYNIKFQSLAYYFDGTNYFYSAPNTNARSVYEVADFALNDINANLQDEEKNALSALIVKAMNMRNFGSPVSQITQLKTSQTVNIKENFCYAIKAQDLTITLVSGEGNIQDGILSSSHTGSNIVNIKAYNGVLDVNLEFNFTQDIINLNDYTYILGSTFSYDTLVPDLSVTTVKMNDQILDAQNYTISQGVLTINNISSLQARTTFKIESASGVYSFDAIPKFAALTDVSVVDDIISFTQQENITYDLYINDERITNIISGVNINLYYQTAGINNVQVKCIGSGDILPSELSNIVAVEMLPSARFAIKTNNLTTIENSFTEDTIHGKVEGLKLTATDANAGFTSVDTIDILNSESIMEFRTLNEVNTGIITNITISLIDIEDPNNILEIVFFINGDTIKYGGVYVNISYKDYSTSGNSGRVVGMNFAGNKDDNKFALIKYDKVNNNIDINGTKWWFTDGTTDYDNAYIGAANNLTGFNKGAKMIVEFDYIEEENGILLTSLGDLRYHKGQMISLSEFEALFPIKAKDGSITRRLDYTIPASNDPEIRGIYVAGNTDSNFEVKQVLDVKNGPVDIMKLRILNKDCVSGYKNNNAYEHRLSIFVRDKDDVESYIKVNLWCDTGNGHFQVITSSGYDSGQWQGYGIGWDFALKESGFTKIGNLSMDYSNRTITFNQVTHTITEGQIPAFNNGAVVEFVFGDVNGLGEVLFIQQVMQEEFEALFPIKAKDGSITRKLNYTIPAGNEPEIKGIYVAGNTDSSFEIKQPIDVKSGPVDLLKIKVLNNTCVNGQGYAYRLTVYIRDKDNLEDYIRFSMMCDNSNGYLHVTDEAWSSTYPQGSLGWDYALTNNGLPQVGTLSMDYATRTVSFNAASVILNESQMPAFNNGAVVEFVFGDINGTGEVLFIQQVMQEEFETLFPIQSKSGTVIRKLNQNVDAIGIDPAVTGISVAGATGTSFEVKQTIDIKSDLIDIMKIRTLKGDWINGQGRLSIFIRDKDDPNDYVRFSMMCNSGGSGWLHVWDEKHKEITPQGNLGWDYELVNTELTKIGTLKMDYSNKTISFNTSSVVIPDEQMPAYNNGAIIELEFGEVSGVCELLLIELAGQQL